MTMREPITIDDRGMSLPPYHSSPIIINVRSTAAVLSSSRSKKSTSSSNAPLKESITITNITDESSISSSNATIKSCIINLANTILGAGMLGLPGAFGGTGYLTGLILTLLSSLLSLHGLLLLAQSAMTIKRYPSSFYTVARAAVPSYTILIDASVAMKCFGVATGYLITVADCFIEVCDRLWEGEGGFLVERKFWVLIALIGVLPVSFFREFDKLSHASGVALCFVLALVTGIVMYKESDWLGDPCGDEEEMSCRGVVEVTTSVGRTVSKLPIFVFAFTCQQNIFPIVNEIQGRSMQRVRYVVVGAILISLIVFVVVAVEGYRTFGSEVKGDIMLNYPETGAVTVMRVFIAVMLILHYPLQLDPSRRCLLSLIKVVIRWWSSCCWPSWWWGSEGVEREMSSLNLTEYSSITASVRSSTTPCSKGYFGVSSSAINDTTECEKLVSSSSVTPKDDDDDDDASTNDDNVAFYTVTISFLLLSVMIAMIVDDLGVILAMVGATGSTLVSYVLPGLIYVKIHREKEGIMTVEMVMAYVQLVLGCIIMPVALYFVLYGDVSE